MGVPAYHFVPAYVQEFLNAAAEINEAIDSYIRNVVFLS